MHTVRHRVTVHAEDVTRVEGDVRLHANGVVGGDEEGLGGGAGCGMKWRNRGTCGM